MREKLPAAVWALGVVLAGAAVAQLVLVAVGTATNQDWAGPVALLAMLVAAPVCITVQAGRAPVLLGPAAAAAVIVEQFRLDPYYLPSHQRYAENAPMTFIAVVSAALVVSAAATLRFPRAGSVLVGILLVPLLFSSFVGALH